MKKKLVLLFFLSLCFFCSLYAQENIKPLRTSKNSIGLSVGYNYGWFKDTNYSPLIYTSKGRLFTLAYERVGKKGNLFQTNIRYSNGIDTTLVSEIFTSIFFQGDIELAWLKQLKLSNPKTKIYVGGQYHLDFNFSIYNSTDESFTFLIGHRFELKTQIDHQLNEKHKLKFGVALPLVTLMVRPPWSGYDDELDKNQDRPLRLITNGDWQTWNKFQAVDLSAGYEFQINDKLSTAIDYKFNFQNETQFKQAQHQVMTGLTLKF